MKTKLPSWKPQHLGNRYCSPACGHGCTYQEYQNAIADGKTLAQELGKGWTHRVWENLGWHFEAIYASNEENAKQTWIDRLRVAAHTHRGETHFTAYYQGDAEHGDTARKAVQNVLKVIREKRDRLNDRLEDVEGCV